MILTRTAQDCMEYTNYARHGNEPVEGFILQAPVSDRESLEIVAPDWKESLRVADEMIADGRSDHCVPKDKVPPIVNAPITAYRLRSLIAKEYVQRGTHILVSPERVCFKSLTIENATCSGDDDYFSSDLEDDKVKRYWSRFQRPALVLHSEKDEFVSKHVDQAALNKKYREAGPNVSPLSGLIPNTGHTVLNDEARQWLAEKVAEFLQTL